MGPQTTTTKGGFTATIKGTPVTYVPRYSGKGKARTGQQLNVSIFMGPTYYQRLKKKKHLYYFLKVLIVELMKQYPN